MLEGILSTWFSMLDSTIKYMQDFQLCPLLTWSETLLVVGEFVGISRREGGKKGKAKPLECVLSFCLQTHCSG